MMKILAAEPSSELLAQLHQWFEAEWGAVDATCDEGLPAPLLAVNHAGELAGGLAFSWFTQAGETCVWINALLVAPEYRGQGVASKLIQAAERAAIDLNIAKLMVFTNRPTLYQRLGWTQQATHGQDTSLYKTLN